jgi:hypothetical protein
VTSLIEKFLSFEIHCQRKWREGITIRQRGSSRDYFREYGLKGGTNP